MALHERALTAIAAHHHETSRLGAIAYLLTFYFFACAFYNTGFFLTIDSGVGFARAVFQLEDFLSLPIVPMTQLTITLFSRLSLELILMIIVLFGFLAGRDTWRRRYRHSNAKRRWLTIHPLVTIVLAVIAISTINVSMLAIVRFPEFPGYSPNNLAQPIGTLLLFSIAVFFVAPRRFGVGYQAYLAVVAYYLMLLCLSMGVSVGTSLQTRTPDDRIELANGQAAIGTTVATVQGGVVFIEFTTDGKRESMFYGDQQVLRIGPIPAAEQRGSDIPVTRRPILCSFLNTWSLLRDQDPCGLLGFDPKPSPTGIG
jgi:hypothetical protein